MKKELIGVPHAHRGFAYKVQWFNVENMAWKDVQKRYPTYEQAAMAADALYQRAGNACRVMKLDLDKGTRSPIEWN